MHTQTLSKWIVRTTHPNWNSACWEVFAISEFRWNIHGTGVWWLSTWIGNKKTIFLLPFQTWRIVHWQFYSLSSVMQNSIIDIRHTPLHAHCSLLSSKKIKKKYPSRDSFTWKIWTDQKNSMLFKLLSSCCTYITDLTEFALLRIPDAQFLGSFSKLWVKTHYSLLSQPYWKGSFSWSRRPKQKNSFVIFNGDFIKTNAIYYTKSLACVPFFYHPNPYF